MMRVKNKNILFQKNLTPRKKSNRILKAIIILGVSLLVLVFFLKFILVSKFLKVNKIELVNYPSAFYKENEFLLYLETIPLQTKWRSFLGPENILFWIGDFYDKGYKIPLVKNIEKEIDFWNKKVKIYITLREPEGVICDEGSNCYFFDKEGIVFLKGVNMEGPLILKINDETGRRIVLGQKIFPNDVWNSNFNKVVLTMQKKGFKILETGFYDLSKEEWYLKITEGTLFYFSFNFVPDRLEDVLDDIIKRVNFKNTSYIDFRVENRIYYK